MHLGAPSTATLCPVRAMNANANAGAGTCRVLEAEAVTPYSLTFTFAKARLPEGRYTLALSNSAGQATPTPRRSSSTTRSSLRRTLSHAKTTSTWSCTPRHRPRASSA